LRFGDGGFGVSSPDSESSCNYKLVSAPKQNKVAFDCFQNVKLKRPVQLKLANTYDNAPSRQNLNLLDTALPGDFGAFYFYFE
jgi:hypothetical protein